MRVLCLHIMIILWFFFFLQQGDGVEEVIVCAWDGQTYILNSKRQIARFQFDEPTAAFVAGT